MKIAIIEEGGELTAILQEEIAKKAQTATFEVKKALDLFDVLAYGRKMIASDHLIIVAQLDTEETELNKVFYSGLAMLEEETGKNIFKCIYTDADDGEEMVRELAETFLNYVLGVPKKQKEEEESFF